MFGVVGVAGSVGVVAVGALGYQVVVYAVYLLVEIQTCLLCLLEGRDVVGGYDSQGNWKLEVEVWMVPFRRRAAKNCCRLRLM